MYSSLFNGQLSRNFDAATVIPSMPPVGEGISTGLFPAICSTIFAYEGWIVATTINYEIKDSKKNLPIALCIEGKEQSSEQLAQTIERAAVGGEGNLTFMIGGSWGLSEAVKSKARVRLSMSPMTFPHQLARVMLCEQLYRAMQILSGGQYHK